MQVKKGQMFIASNIHFKVFTSIQLLDFHFSSVTIKDISSVILLMRFKCDMKSYFVATERERER